MATTPTATAPTPAPKGKATTAPKGKATPAPATPAPAPATPAPALATPAPATWAAYQGAAPAPGRPWLPQPGSVLAAVLATLQANGGTATLGQLQAAVAACGKAGAHPVVPLLRWATKAHGSGWAVTPAGVTWLPPTAL